jgi:hypothetical protein
MGTARIMSIRRRDHCGEEDVSRKGAKAQSATAFLKAFFAPLREKYFVDGLILSSMRTTGLPGT